MPGSQGKCYGDNNNCTDGCLALVEHTTNGNGRKIIRKKCAEAEDKKVVLR